MVNISEGCQVLGEKERGYLEIERPRYLNKVKAGRIRKHDDYIRKKAEKAIEYLKYLAENLVPDQHEQVFSEEKISPLIEAIFPQTSKHPEWKNETSKAIISDERLFRLAVRTSQVCINKSVELINSDVRQLVRGVSKRAFPDEQDLELVKTLYIYPNFLKKVNTE
jgi:hypothetical protein